MGYVVVREERHHNAGVVYDTHLLGLFLGTQHNERRKDGDGGKQHRCQERDEKETLLFDFIQVFTLNNNSHFTKVHSYSSSVTSLINMSFIRGITSLKEWMVTPWLISSVRRVFTSSRATTIFLRVRVASVNSISTLS